MHVEAIGEVECARIKSLTGLFDPASFYGRTPLWMFSLALRLSLGAPMPGMMGRYGVLAVGAQPMKAAMHEMP